MERRLGSFPSFSRCCRCLICGPWKCNFSNTFVLSTRPLGIFIPIFISFSACKSRTLSEMTEMQSAVRQSPQGRHPNTLSPVLPCVSTPTAKTVCVAGVPGKGPDRPPPPALTSVGTELFLKSSRALHVPGLWSQTRFTRAPLQPRNWARSGGAVP